MVTFDIKWKLSEYPMWHKMTWMLNRCDKLFFIVFSLKIKTTYFVKVWIKTSEFFSFILGWRSATLKDGGEAGMTRLTNIFNQVWSTEQIPEDWGRGIILPFWKRKGDALTCSYHRDITLLSIPGKTFAWVVINRAIPVMNHHCRPHQAGFIPRRSTIDLISDIRLLAEKAR